MVTYYELLEDNTIGKSTPSERVAKSLGLTLSTDKEIIYAWNGKRYFKGEEPEQPKPSKEEILAEKRVLRNKYLESSDKYMLSDFPISSTERNKWKEYRVYLRDFFNDEIIAVNTHLKTFEEYFS